MARKRKVVKIWPVHAQQILALAQSLPKWEGEFRSAVSDGDMHVEEFRKPIELKIDDLGTGYWVAWDEDYEDWMIYVEARLGETVELPS